MIRAFPSCLSGAVSQYLGKSFSVVILFLMLCLFHFLSLSLSLYFSLSISLSLSLFTSHCTISFCDRGDTGSPWPEGPVLPVLSPSCRDIANMTCSIVLFRLWVLTRALLDLTKRGRDFGDDDGIDVKDFVGERRTLLDFNSFGLLVVGDIELDFRVLVDSGCISVRWASISFLSCWSVSSWLLKRPVRSTWFVGFFGH